jgi:hypothetical protein
MLFQGWVKIHCTFDRAVGSIAQGYTSLIWSFPLYLPLITLAVCFIPGALFAGKSG